MASIYFKKHDGCEDWSIVQVTFVVDQEREYLNDLLDEYAKVQDEMAPLILEQLRVQMAQAGHTLIYHS